MLNYFVCFIDAVSMRLWTVGFNAIVAESFRRKVTKSDELFTLEPLKRLVLCGITTMVYYRGNHFNQSLLLFLSESMSMELFRPARLKFFRKMTNFMPQTLKGRKTGSSVTTILILCLGLLMKHTKSAEKWYQRSKVIIRRYKMIFALLTIKKCQFQCPTLLGTTL